MIIQRSTATRGRRYPGGGQCAPEARGRDPLGGSAHGQPRLRQHYGASLLPLALEGKRPGQAVLGFGKFRLNTEGLPEVADRFL